MWWQKIRQLWQKQRRISLGKYDYELLGSLESTILVVANSYKVREEIGCKEDKSLGVYEWSVDGITEGNMIGTIEVRLEWSSLDIFE